MSRSVRPSEDEAEHETHRAQRNLTKAQAQMGVLASDLANMRQQLTDRKFEHPSMWRGAIGAGRAVESPLSALNCARPGWDQALTRVKMDLEHEVKQRAFTDTEVLSRVEALAHSVDARSDEHVQLNRGLRSLHSKVETSAQQLGTLRDMFSVEVVERQAATESARSALGELREHLTKDAHERSLLADALKLEVEDRKIEVAGLRDQVVRWQKVAEERQDLTNLRVQVQEVVCTVKSHQESLEREVQRRVADQELVERRVSENHGILKRRTENAHENLERRLTELSECVSSGCEKECVARTALTQMVESLTARIQSVDKDWRSALSDLQSVLGETQDLCRNTKESFDLHEAFVKKQLSSHANHAKEQVTLSARMASLEQQCQEDALKLLQDAEAGLSRLQVLISESGRAEQTAREALQVEMENHLLQERRAREVLELNVENEKAQHKLVREAMEARLEVQIAEERRAREVELAHERTARHAHETTVPRTLAEVQTHVEAMVETLRARMGALEQRTQQDVAQVREWEASKTRAVEDHGHVIRNLQGSVDALVESAAQNQALLEASKARGVVLEGRVEHVERWLQERTFRPAEPSR